MNRPPWKDRDWLARGGPAPEPASPLYDQQMQEFFEKELVRIELECHNPPLDFPLIPVVEEYPF